MNNPGGRLQSNRETIRSFGTFLESWMTRQHHHLEELLSAADRGPDSAAADLQDLITRVLAHYQQYFDEKSRVAVANVLILFGPPWLSRIERALLWVAGFKPGMAVRLAATAVDDLTDDQRREMERVRARTRAEEKALDDEMATIQESLGSPSLMEVTRRCGRPPRDGQDEEREAVEAVESVKADLEGAVAAADLLRMRTAVAVVEVLTPLQKVRFLAAAARLQLDLHRCGSQRER